MFSIATLTEGAIESRLKLSAAPRPASAITGVATDVLTPMALHERFRQAVLAEALPELATRRAESRPG